MTETRKCPAFGAGSVDFDAIHEADAKGKNLSEAIEAARVKVDAPHIPADPPSVAGMTRPELLETAANEGVDVDAIEGTGAGGYVIADDISTAIEAHRAEVTK